MERCIASRISELGISWDREVVVAVQSVAVHSDFVDIPVPSYTLESFALSNVPPSTEAVRMGRLNFFFKWGFVGVKKWHQHCCKIPWKYPKN